MSATYAKRYETVFLCTHARGPHLSYSAAAKVLKKSKNFVQMQIERYMYTKTVDDCLVPFSCRRCDWAVLFRG